LKAKEAKSRIVKLRTELIEGKRFASEPHDLTLEMQIRWYLKYVWDEKD
jgi:hypothetical protein